MMHRTSRRDGLDLGLHFLDTAGEATSKQEEEARDARAAANIAEWRTFLPDDCVDTMIRAGWHRTV